MPLNSYHGFEYGTRVKHKATGSKGTVVERVQNYDPAVCTYNHTQAETIPIAKDGDGRLYGWSPTECERIEVLKDVLKDVKVKVEVPKYVFGEGYVFPNPEPIPFPNPNPVPSMPEEPKPRFIVHTINKEGLEIICTHPIEYATSLSAAIDQRISWLGPNKDNAEYIFLAVEENADNPRQFNGLMGKSAWDEENQKLYQVELFY